MSSDEIAVVSYGLHVAFRAPTQAARDQMIAEFIKLLRMWQSNGRLKISEKLLAELIKHLKWALGESGSFWEGSIGDLAGYGVPEWETTNNRMEGSFSSTDKTVFDSMLNSSMVVLIESLLGITSTGSDSHRRQFFDLFGTCSNSTAAGDRVFSAKAHERHRQLRGVWAAQLTPRDMGGVVPIVHTNDQTLVRKGIANVIGYPATEEAQMHARQAVVLGNNPYSFAPMIKLLDPPNLLTQPNYYTVIGDYGPHNNGWYCSSPEGPCADYLWRGSLGYACKHICSRQAQLGLFGSPSAMCNAFSLALKNREQCKPLAFTDQILANGSFAEKRMLLLSGAVSSSVSSVAPAQDQPPPHGTAPPPPPMGASSSSMMGIVFSVEVPANVDVTATITVVSTGRGLRVMRTMADAAQVMPFTTGGQRVARRSFMTNDVVTHVDGVPVGSDVSILHASSSPRVLTGQGVPTTHLKTMTYQQRGVLGMEPEYRRPGGGRERFRNPLNMHHDGDFSRPSDVRAKPQKGKRNGRVGASASSSSSSASSSSGRGLKRKRAKKTTRSHADANTLAAIAASAGAAAEDSALDALDEDMPLVELACVAAPVAQMARPKSGRTRKSPGRLVEADGS